MKQHVYICSQPRNGSTLLSLLLGSHPSVISVGELNLFGEMRRTNAFCSCGAPIQECLYWREIIELLGYGKPADSGSDPDIFHTQRFSFNYPDHFGSRLISAIYLKSLNHQYTWLATLAAAFPGTFPFDANRAAENHKMVVEKIFTHSGQQDVVVLDSTKTTRRLLELLPKSSGVMKIIVLLRDGRGSVNSYLKSGDDSFEEVVSLWKYHMEKQMKALSVIKEELKMTIKYEDLCENPETVLSRICRFLNIPYDTLMLEFHGPYHSLGGNYPAYRRNSISLDNEWERKLTSDQLALFDKIGGDTNRMNGYC